jgi:hypothetical protein
MMFRPGRGGGSSAERLDAPPENQVGEFRRSCRGGNAAIHEPRALVPVRRDSTHGYNPRPRRGRRPVKTCVTVSISERDNSPLPIQGVGSKGLPASNRSKLA